MGLTLNKIIRVSFASLIIAACCIYPARAAGITSDQLSQLSKSPKPEDMLLLSVAAFDAKGVSSAFFDGANPNRTNRVTGEYPVFAIITDLPRIEIQDILDAFARAGYDFTIQDKSGNTLLHYFADNHYSARLDDVKKLAGIGKTINAKNRNGDTPLMVAAKNDDSEMMAVLIEAGADINAEDAQGLTAIFYAASPKTAELLIKAGASVNTKKGKEKITPLFSQIERGDIQMARLLLSKGASPNARNAKGQSALQYAMELENTDITQLLLNAR